MKKLFARFFGRLSNFFRKFEYLLQSEPKEIEQESKQQVDESIKDFQKNKKKTSDKSRNKIIREDTLFVKDPRDIRDIMELMGVPLVSISKKRTSPMVYESPDGSIKVKITPLAGHYLASVYDWDIVMCVTRKIQEIINSNKDIPPRTIVIPRYELLKELRRHDGKKQKEDLEESLKRLQSTVIETTIWNEDYRYKSGFSFLDNWGYTERKDVKEFRITLSEWLHYGACKKGALLKADPIYFNITSGLNRFLYRTARKHVGNQKQWDFLVETIYHRSGSDREFKKFKHDLKKSVHDNNIPGYFMKWIQKEGKEYIRFSNKKKELEDMVHPSEKSEDEKFK